MQPEETQDPLAYIKTWHRDFAQIGWWHSFELPGGEVIQGVSNLAAQKMRIAQFPIPQDLRGKRVLDVGTWDGWFAMEMERRGAEVVAIDRFDNPRFHDIKALLNSRVDYRELSVYDLDPTKLGRFDIVLFMGVLYHLKHPLLALERVCSVAKDLVAVESFVLKDRHKPGLGVESESLMAFYEGDEFGGEFDNWVAPTVPCLMALCRTAGFVRVELNHVHDYGAAVSCFRTRVQVPGTAIRKIQLVGAFHTANGGINFHTASSEDYVCCRVVMDGGDLNVESVFPEVGGYAAQPTFVGLVDGFWQINFRLPPGLSPAWHEVRLRTPDGESNTVEIAVDVPLVTDSVHLKITGACDGVDWQPWRMAVHHRFASVWVHGLPRGADKSNVKVDIGGTRQLTTFVGEADADGVVQVNVSVKPYTLQGSQPLELRIEDCVTPPVNVEIVP